MGLLDRRMFEFKNDRNGILIYQKNELFYLSLHFLTFFFTQWGKCLDVVPGQNWSSLRRILLSIYLDLKIVINHKTYLKFFDVSWFRFHLVYSYWKPEGDVSRWPQLNYTKCKCSWTDPTAFTPQSSSDQLVWTQFSVFQRQHTHPPLKRKSHPITRHSVSATFVVCH
jgi:hypothetical protein